MGNNTLGCFESHRYKHADRCSRVQKTYTIPCLRVLFDWATSAKRLYLLQPLLPGLLCRDIRRGAAEQRFGHVCSFWEGGGGLCQHAAVFRDETFFTRDGFRYLLRASYGSVIVIDLPPQHLRKGFDGAAGLLEGGRLLVVFHRQQGDARFLQHPPHGYIVEFLWIAEFCHDPQDPVGPGCLRQPYQLPPPLLAGVEEDAAPLRQSSRRARPTTGSAVTGVSVRKKPDS